MIEIFLKYDDLEGSVILRFLGIQDFRIAPVDRDDSFDTIAGALLLMDEDNLFTWLSDDSYPVSEIDKIKEYATWVKADRIIWAVTNSQGIPDEMPAWKIDQRWNIYGVITEKHFVLKEYTETVQQ